jgi:IclR family transcriptional regulator, acetate operon repressor
VLGLLDILARPDARLGLTEIARISGYDKATIRRQLVELMANGFVEQDDASRDDLRGPTLCCWAVPARTASPFLGPSCLPCARWQKLLVRRPTLLSSAQAG